MGGPEIVSFSSLVSAAGGDACVGPGDGPVAVSDRPVALLDVSNLKFRGFKKGKLTFQAGVP